MTAYIYCIPLLWGTFAMDFSLGQQNSLKITNWQQWIDREQCISEIDMNQRCQLNVFEKKKNRCKVMLWGRNNNLKALNML